MPATYQKRGYSRCGSNPNSRHLGTKHPLAKLTREKIEHARQQRNQGQRLSDLAESLGVTAGTLCKAIKGRTWA